MRAYRSHPPHPRLLVQIRREVHHGLASGRIMTTPAIREHLAPVLEDDLPATPWLEALLAEDEMLQQVGRAAWVHVGAVLDGRVFTCHVEGGESACGAGQVDDVRDLRALLGRYPGWERIPLRFARRRGWLDRTGGLWLPEAALAGLTALVPTAEGVVAGRAEIDPVADRRLCDALRRIAALGQTDAVPHDGDQHGGGPPDRDAGGGLAVLYRALAVDHRLALMPTRPLSALPLQVPSRAA